MEKLKVLIVEDDFIIAESLKVMLENMGYEIPAIFISGEATLENFKPGFADIIIMDIQLADNTNGIDTSIEIRKISTAPIIFITDNQDEYLRKKAIYETNTVQYLTKPFNELDISIAIDLAIKALKGHNLSISKANESSYLINDCIFVKDNQGFKKIMLEDIMFLQADGSYCYLTYRNTDINASETVMYSENLSFLEEKFKFANELVRVHRSFIININSIKKIKENRLWIDDKEIPIGKTYRNEIKDRFRFI
ncbi:MAG: response regulator transcription factor [Bacteroidota bacterium]